MNAEETRAQELGITGEALLAHRRHFIRPVTEQLERWVDAVAPTLLPSEQLMLFAGSTEGAHRACVLLGAIATCRTVGVPVQAYLTWAFERLGTHRDVFGLSHNEITPAAFKKSIGLPTE